jgi:hypothetical protein
MGRASSVRDQNIAGASRERERERKKERKKERKEESECG